MPRVTLLEAKTETLLEWLKIEQGHWGSNLPERFRPLVAAIELELVRRGIKPWDSDDRS